MGRAIWAREAKGAGFDLVYQATSSIAQPDFTAECLSARNAGAQVLLPALDTNSVVRMVSSCARQGYAPSYALYTAEIKESFKDDRTWLG